jgi:cell division protein FtsW (lipid II flippase)
MGVTLSRAADRRARPAPGGRAAWSLAGKPRRGREAAHLALAALAVVCAMLLAWFAVARPLPDAAARLARGELHNLNPAADAPGAAGGGAAGLAAVLGFVPNPQERSYIAERIGQRLAAAPLANVGELGRLTVPAAEVDAHRMPGIAARLAAGRDKVALLSAAELRQLKASVVVRTPAEYRWSYIFGALLLLAGFAAAHVVLRLRGHRGDELLLPAMLLFCGLGFAVMASLRDPLRDLPLHLRFAEGVFAGCACFLLGALVDIERTVLPRRGAWALALAAALSALLILFGGGPGVSDAKVNFLGFQPVELIKILIALFLASYFANRWEFLREVPERRVRLGPAGRALPLPRLEYVLPPLVAVGLILFFFFLQKDLGPALVLACLFLILFSVARARPGMALCGLVLVAGAFFVGYKLGYPRTVGQRIGMWIAPWDTWFRGGDHLAQALWSLSAGGATGTGLGLGEPGLVPEAHTDMVMSAIGEQLGFCGLAAVAGLYALVVQRGLRAARRASTAYGFFLALGLTLLVGLETALIAGGVLGLLPLSGVTSPFLSSGRSAMLGNCLIAGLLVGISGRGDGRDGRVGEAARPFRGGVRWIAAGLGLFAVVALLRLADVQLLHADGYLTRGAVVLQGDGVRRFLFNPRLATIAATIPRGSIVDRNGLPLATSDPLELERNRQALEKLGATDLGPAPTEAAADPGAASPGAAGGAANAGALAGAANTGDPAVSGSAANPGASATTADAGAAATAGVTGAPATAGASGAAASAGAPAGAGAAAAWAAGFGLPAFAMGGVVEPHPRIYPFGGRTFHLLGDVRNRVNWRAHNNSFVERDARVRLQGYDDYAGVVAVRQVDGTEAPQVMVNYRELVPLLRHRYQPDDPEVKAILGRDRTVRLTIDARLQMAAAEVLQRYATQAGFGGAAVVLDAATGDLLAAASYPFPAHLPAEPTPGSGGELLDRARYGIYPPGSTFKIVTALAALRKDPSLATRTFECRLLPDGRIGNYVDRRAVHDDPSVTVPHGIVDLDKGIRHSCNAYFAQLATAGVGADALLATARLFGIAVARPNTAAALATALPQAAYGQGQVIATPFQMARVAAAVAAAGRMPEGRWMLGADNPRSGVPLPVADPAAATIVAHAMRGVVTEGTAAAFLAGVQPPIAGKTGTSEVPGKKSHSWFIGYAPYGEAPRRLAFAVIVEHGGYGGRLAAPAAGEIVRRAAALGLFRQDANERTAP